MSDHSSLPFASVSEFELFGVVQLQILPLSVFTLLHDLSLLLIAGNVPRQVVSLQVLEFSRPLEFVLKLLPVVLLPLLSFGLGSQFGTSIALPDSDIGVFGA